MNRAGGKQPHKMKLSAGFLYAAYGFRKGLVLEERTVFYGGRNSGQIIVDYFPGADGQMTHLAVSRLAPRQADGDSRSLQSGERKMFFQFGEIWLVGDFPSGN